MNMTKSFQLPVLMEEAEKDSDGFPFSKDIVARLYVKRGDMAGFQQFMVEHFEVYFVKDMTIEQVEMSIINQCLKS